MSAVSTKDSAKFFLKRFLEKNPAYTLNSGAVRKFEKLCELADLLDEEFGAKDIQVRSEENFGVVSVDLFDVEFSRGRSHPFFEYIKSADFLNFSKGGEDTLRIQFGVRDLWLKV